MCACCDATRHYSPPTRHVTQQSKLWLLGNRGKLMHEQRDFELRRTRVQRATKSLFDRAQSLFDGLAGHPQRGRRGGDAALCGKISTQCLTQYLTAVARVFDWRNI